MIRRALLRLTALLFLFWLLWPRAWLPRSWSGGGESFAVSGAPFGDGPAAAAGEGSRAEEQAARDQDLSADQVAVLLLDPSQDAFAAGRVLRAAGVPFMVTGSLDAALAHRIVFVPAGDRTMATTDEEEGRLRAFVSAGGTLALQVTASAPWPDLTGVDGVSPSRGRRKISFRAGADPGFAFLSRPEQFEIPLASPATEEGFWTGGLKIRPGEAEAVATFPDTLEPALTRRGLGAGRVYALGADLRDLFVRPQAGRAFDAARRTSNAYEPAADVWPLIFRAWYEAYTPGWIRLRSLPADSSGLLLLGHSIAAGVAPTAALQWAVWESSRGAAATWFVRTSRPESGLPGPFYDEGLARVLRSISALGGELAARGVVDDPDFETVPHGDGVERAAGYRPALDAGRIWGETQSGEVRVPKELLERGAPGVRIEGFRAPARAFPAALDELLTAAGYSWDSSPSAARVLTNFPYFLTRGRAMTASSRVLELPATFDDEPPSEGPAPDASAILKTLRDVSAEEGVIAWDSRPSPGALPRLAAVLDGLPSGTRVETLGRAARWWAARERARFWLEPASDAAPKSRTLCLILTPDADRAELSFEASGSVVGCESLTPGLEIECSGRVIRLVRTGGARNAALAYELE